jgi:hypothetical protein
MNNIFNDPTNIFGNINRGLLYVIDGRSYGFNDKDKVHEIVDRSIIQKIETNHTIYYGAVDMQTLGLNNKFVKITTVFGEEYKVNVDEVRNITDVQLVIVKFDVTGYSNTWKRIEGKSWAYLYKFFVFGVKDKVLISSSVNTGGEKISTTDGNHCIGHVLDYEDRDEYIGSGDGEFCDPLAR